MKSSKVRVGVIFVFKEHPEGLDFDKSLGCCAFILHPEERGGDEEKRLLNYLWKLGFEGGLAAYV